MRPKILLLSFGLLSLSCDNKLLVPPGEVQGTWKADFNVPGPSLVLDITQADSTIAGGGTYAIEAGGAGTLQVSGFYTRPNIKLTIRRDDGYTETYTGTVLNARLMTGAVADSTGYTFALNFTRR
jgi:hypothetical protein